MNRRPPTSTLFPYTTLFRSLPHRSLDHRPAVVRRELRARNHEGLAAPAAPTPPALAPLLALAGSGFAPPPGRPHRRVAAGRLVDAAGACHVAHGRPPAKPAPMPAVSPHGARPTAIQT